MARGMKNAPGRSGRAHADVTEAVEHHLVDKNPIGGDRIGEKLGNCVVHCGAPSSLEACVPSESLKRRFIERNGPAYHDERRR